MLEVDAVIKKFRDYVVQQSRSNLTKSGHNNTKGLYNSIKGEVVTDKGFSIVGFSMDDYGQFVDKGVKGKTSSAKAPNSPYKFGTGTGKKGGLTNGINKWVKQKGFQFRDRKSGRFLSYDSTAYLITRSIYHKGIKPSLFFTKPFEAGYKKYIDIDLLKAFGQDVETMVDYNLKDIK
jgi:hypothetical protein